MKIQNIADTITADPADFVWDDTTTFKFFNRPFLIEEYYITETSVSDYQTRVSVLDEDKNPVVTAVVDIYDDLDEAKRQLAFVGSLTNNFRHGVTSDARLRSLLDSYGLFMEKTTIPEDPRVFYHGFEDLQLLGKVIDYVKLDRDAEDFFAPHKLSRKNGNRQTDYTVHPFRETAIQIANAFRNAS